MVRTGPSLFPLGLVQLLLLLSALAGTAYGKEVEKKPFFFDQPLQVPIEAGVIAAFNPPVFEDINSDGRADMVAINGQEPYRPSRLAIYLSRPGGFDGPTYIEPPDCSPTFRLINADVDRAKEILLICTHDTYSLFEQWVQVIDIGSDGTVHSGPRLDLPEVRLAPTNVLDLDQDGLDDLVFNVRWTPSAWIFKTVVYYNRGVGTWHRVEGPEFSPPGYDITKADPPLDYHYTGGDIDGDGAQDIMWGWCPTWCMVEQEPWGQIVGAPLVGTEYYANSTSFGDLDGDGAQDMAMPGGDGFVVWLQTADRTFQPALQISGLYGAANPKISDFDLNGLADIVIVDEDYLIWILQVAPGEFELHWSPVPLDNPQGTLDVQIADVDADGCPDAILPLHANGFWMFRGRNCLKRSNLEVNLVTTGTAVTANVRHVLGADTMTGQVLRLVLAPQTKDATQLGVQVVPPSGCIPVALRAPRTTYDCLLPDVAPSGSVSLQFKVAYTGLVVPEVPMQATAILLDSAGDNNKADNRDFARFYPRQPVAPSLRNTGARPAAKRTIVRGKHTSGVAQ